MRTNRKPFSQAGTANDRLYAYFHRENPKFWALYEEIGKIKISAQIRSIVNRTICYDAKTRWTLDDIENYG